MSYFFKIAQKWIYKEMGIGLTEKKKQLAYNNEQSANY